MSNQVGLVTRATQAPGAQRRPAAPVTGVGRSQVVTEGAGRGLNPSVLGSGVAAVLLVIYVALAVQQHRQLMTSGFDLGIFEQDVRSYAAGRLPVSDLKGPGFPRLGDHFSPIMAVLAPFYLLFPSALTLLVGQAVALALAAVPLTSWAARARGSVAALVVGFGYGLSWGIAPAVGFDVHEVAFGVPMIAFAAVALGQGRHRAAVLWALPLVLVKEDLGLTLAALGVLVAWRGSRALGMSAAAVGLLSSGVEITMIIPAFNPAGRNDFTPSLRLHDGLTTLLTTGQDTKLATAFLLLAPTAFLAVRSPILLLAAPTLAWRFLSDRWVYWSHGYHYSAVLMPVVFAAMVDVLARERTRHRAALVASVIVTALLVPTNPLVQLTSPSFWTRRPQVVSTQTLLAQIPSGTTVSASNWLAPQLTDRTDVSLFGLTPLDTSKAQWVVVDTAEKKYFPVDAKDQRALLDQALASGSYRQVDQRGPVVLLERCATTCSG